MSFSGAQSDGSHWLLATGQWGQELNPGKLVLTVADWAGPQVPSTVASCCSWHQVVQVVAKATGHMAPQWHVGISGEIRQASFNIHIISYPCVHIFPNDMSCLSKLNIQDANSVNAPASCCLPFTLSSVYVVLVRPTCNITVTQHAPVVLLLLRKKCGDAPITIIMSLSHLAPVVKKLHA